MSRFYSNNLNTITDKNKTTDIVNSVIAVVPVTTASEYKENLIKQQSNIPLLTQYDDIILKNTQNLINRYNYIKLQWSSEYYKDKAMLKAEYKQSKEAFENIFKKGNEYEYGNTIVPSLLYSTIGYHSSKILLKNHFIMRNFIGVLAFVKIFEFNSPETYRRAKAYWNEKVKFGQEQKKDLENKVSSLKKNINNTVEDIKINNDVFLQENIHDLRVKVYDLLYKK